MSRVLRYANGSEEVGQRMSLMVEERDAGIYREMPVGIGRCGRLSPKRLRPLIVTVWADSIRPVGRNMETEQYSY